MSAAAALRARPGRPSSGARERILAAGLEVLKAEGYAGLTVAKVAAAAGENKALIAYHFGSKQGLVAAVGAELGESITEEILTGLAGASTVEQIVRGVLAGIWTLMDRDVRLVRLYFDLTAVSVVEDDVRAVMREVRRGWQRVLAGLLREADPALTPAQARAAAALVQAGIAGLALERIQEGDTPDLRRARELFVRSALAAVAD